MKLKTPHTTGNFNDAKFNAIKLAKLGYYGGNPSLVLEEDASIILDILCYEKFDNEFNYMLNLLNTKKTNNK